MGLLGKTLLAGLTMFALFDAIGAGAFVAPLLLPLLWFAASDARSGWTRGAWTFLASLCAWLGGLLVGYNLAGETGWGTLGIPLIATALVSISFVATTGPKVSR